MASTANPDATGTAGDAGTDTAAASPVESHPASALRTAVIWRVLRDVLAQRAARLATTTLTIADVGGGTGGFAVPLAELGHDITVIDPNPDSLAALERRAAEARVTGRVRPVQGDATDLPALVGAHAVDLVLCHNVLEYVDDPAAALRAIVAGLRGGGTVSVTVANPLATAVHRALAGRFAQAARLLDDPAGTWGSGDPVPRRFDRHAVTDLVADAGLRVQATHGVRVFADIVPSSLVDGESGAAEALSRLESAAAVHPELSALATQLHVLALRP